jgi:hypothetical protein
MTQPGVEKESAARAGDGIIAHRDSGRIWVQQHVQ